MPLDLDIAFQPKSGYNLARMRFEIILAPQALDDLRGLQANARTAVKQALETHLRNEPEKTSRSRIKRLRGLTQPQYRLRVDEIRVFYDVLGAEVLVLAVIPKGDRRMARPVRKVNVDAGSRSEARLIPLSEVKDDFSRYLKEAASGEIVITRHGRPAGVLIGFESEEDWLEYRLETDPRFLERIASARAELRAGRGVRLEDIEL